MASLCRTLTRNILNGKSRYARKLLIFPLSVSSLSLDRTSSFPVSLSFDRGHRLIILAPLWGDDEVKMIFGLKPTTSLEEMAALKTRIRYNKTLNFFWASYAGDGYPISPRQKQSLFTYCPPSEVLSERILLPTDVQFKNRIHFLMWILASFWLKHQR